MAKFWISAFSFVNLSFLLFLSFLLSEGLSTFVSLSSISAPANKHLFMATSTKFAFSATLTVPINTTTIPATKHALIANGLKKSL